MPKSRPPSYVFKRNNTKENVNVFLESLRSSDWSSVFYTTDPNTAYNLFYDHINNMYNQYIPLVRVKLKKHQPRKPWITQGLIKSVKVKNKLHSKFLQKRQLNMNKSTKHIGTNLIIF